MAVATSAVTSLLALLLYAQVAASPASEPAQPDDLLALYGRAYGWAALSFRCVPTQSLGGLTTPDYDRIRRRLHERRLRVRERLVGRFGAAPLEELETASDAEFEGVYWTGCDLDETRRARQRYRTLLKRLERRVGL